VIGVDPPAPDDATTSPTDGGDAEMAPVGWGVLGVANIARRAVIPAIQRSRSSRVVAIASRDASKARSAAAALGIPQWYGSYEALLADPAVEAVYIPLPNHLHVPWSMRAADAGKHVLCEKPIALTAAEARQLLGARDRNQVQIAEAFMVRVHPQWLKTKQLVGSGRIAALHLVTGHFSYRLHAPDNIRNRADFGGGVLYDIGCYPIMLSRWLFGAEPETVFADIHRDPASGVDDLTSGVLRFRTGQACFTCAGTLAAHQRMQLFGTGGRIEVEIPFNAPIDRPCRLVVDDGRDPYGAGAEVIEIPLVDQYALQADRFAQAIRGHGTVAMSLEDSIANMAVIDALFRSEQSGRWETPDSGA
jgi:predicted dehydrogenase